MAKLKSSRVVKYDGNEKWVFINGVAFIPGSRTLKVTLKEFNEWKKNEKA